jgi:hypothetical protein
MTRTFVRRWLRFTIATGGALTLWGLAAVQGYAWPMIWLPAAVAGAAWPRPKGRTVTACRRRARKLRRG